VSAEAGSLLPPPPLRERRWIPAIALVALILGVVSGGHLVSGALGETRAGGVAVGDSVEVSPLPGWELADRFEDPTGIRLTSGSASLDVAELPFAGTDVDLLREYVDNVLAPQAEHLRLSEEVETVRLANGLTGSRIAYVGVFGDVQTPVEGEITTAVSPLGTGVVFDAWAPTGQLQLALEDLHTMIETTEIA
jgi:hypothetical protein